MTASNHASLVEVSLSAIAHNLGEIRRVIAPTPVLAIVKGNAYGHGMIEVAQHLEGKNIWGFGVANAHDALVLRKAGITARIVVLGWTDPQAVIELAHNKIEISVFSTEQLAALETALSKSTQPLRAHLKVETGLNRLGFDPADLPIINSKKITLTGVYSHFASVEESKLTQAKQQLERFTKALAHFETPVSRHIASTASALVTPESRFDFVRVGVGLYGLWPSEEVRTLAHQGGTVAELKPALSWKTQIVQIKTIPAGAHVGYGASWQAKRETRVGVLPLGYAQGLPRLYAAHGGEVALGTKRAPIIGRICMDMTMIDLTDLKQAVVGDEVELIGAEITADEMAQKLETINYEVVTRIPREIHREFSK